MRQMVIVAIMGMLVALTMSTSQARPATTDLTGSETQLVQPQPTGESSGAELELASGDSVAGEPDAQTCRVVQLWTGSRCVGVMCCHEACEISPECD